ncbi:MAG TPA: hypothetical protein VM846_00760 [Vicinamibacterales bacterium]|nr:hypothetical protein [Vicinamibacterales bacterium]
MKTLGAIYAVGVVIALWRIDAAWPTRVAVAALWPLGPLAFVVTVAILLAASLIAFPVVAGLTAAGVAGALWWFAWR